MDGIEDGAFKPPLNEEGLRILGLATYNWGMADALLQMIIEKVGVHSRSETAPLSIGRKADRLLANLEQLAEADYISLARDFAQEVKILNEGRNHAVHGFWGWHGDKSEPSYRSAAYSYKASEPFFAEEIIGLNNRIASATILGHRALLLMDGEVLEDQTPKNFFFGNKNPFE